MDERIKKLMILQKPLVHWLSIKFNNNKTYE